MLSARIRRELELHQLLSEGVPLQALGKSGHWTMGHFHIYAAAGRWFSEQTGRRGLLRKQAIRRVWSSNTSRGSARKPPNSPGAWI